MKHKMTLEESDLRDFVEKLLALNGVKSADEIVFKNGKGTKVTGLHIDIKCEMGPELPACPLCGAVKHRVAVVPESTIADARLSLESSNVTSIVPETTPRSYPVDEDIEVDEAMGESTRPPGAEDGSIPDDDSNVASMHALTAMNARLIRDKERALAKQRKKTPRYSGGESDRPPEPGE